MPRKAVLLPYASEDVGELCEELDQTRAGLDLKRPLPRAWARRLRRDVDAEAIAAAVSMEHALVTVDEVHRILGGERPADVTEEELGLVRGYAEARRIALEWADLPNLPWKRDLIVGLHARILAGNWAAGAGELATGQRRVVNRLTGEEVYFSAPPDEVPRLLDQVCLAMDRGGDHPASAAAWVHVALMAILPFRQGNGGVARILASLALQRRGYRGVEFASLEQWWGRHPADYYTALECLGREFDPAVDVTSFIQAHLRAQLSQAHALDLRERTERYLWTAIENLVAEAGLAARLADAVWDAFWGREVTAGCYMRVARVSPATATNDLAAASASGLLRAEGERRGRRYRAGRDLYETVGEIFGVEGQGPDGIERESITAVLYERAGALRRVRDSVI